jgi:hypothetical protein
MTERGQTINDYVIGMTLLLLSITLVFGYFPGIFQPFEEEVSNEEEAMATNLAAELVENSTVTGTKQTVSFDSMNGTLYSFVDAPQQAGIPDWVHWNVTVLDVDGNVITHDGERLAKGTDWRGERAASTVRFVRAQDDNDCDDGCRIVVRVW